ncbi:MAG: type II 3-dehydroquinate dehydratase [Sneathiella sp.]|uniref:type II 3-dehydroquinate dehydratase n=1 Tax=Sneathiella sp. TaxID=1964365 RepID=UPI000C5F5E39|nr:type II 3-dehydroquinate dehydratase [Sneathiella sp.]MAL79590.1 type II 3-dehydroquinate dehydratase [Sneathiella sp.]|tara:strand:- start:393 stop:830 length:438 start_codon:yes stop_codon:yes gene_type:complete
MGKSVIIINGPNLNLLGRREPEIYGHTTLADIETLTRAHGETLGLDVAFFQSNNEGDLVDAIQDAAERHGGIILNAAAYTHTSVALADAIKATGLPVVEVHLSNIFSREEFRHHSYISAVAAGVICGFGAKGYVLALEALAELID